MDIQEIKLQVRSGDYFYSSHADTERKVEELTLSQVEEALLNGEILEEYPDTGRGESCLIIGFSKEIPIHIVCGWRHDKVVIVTTYIPSLPKFLDPWTRRKEKNENDKV